MVGNGTGPVTVREQTIPSQVLLLQGPIGPFFSRLADELKSEGHEVFKIHFNGGDEACYAHSGAQRYTGDLTEWPAFLASFIEQHAIDRIFLFGDCRPYHLRATRVARESGVSVYVFDEGYVRPDYITLEPGGVNGFSSLSRDPKDYQSSAPKRLDSPHSAGAGFWPVARHAMYYYLAAWRRQRAFPHYVHHRPLSPLREGLCWLRSGLRKIYYMGIDRLLIRRLADHSDGYYLVPLQVHCDAQIIRHSGGFTVEGFIARVIRSFAEHAPANTRLVLKHHPMDRGYYHHGRLISVLAAQYAVHDRVHYLHEGHLPTLLSGARGTVTINSTVGLSSALHHTPVKVVGDAVYDMAGLTNQAALETFWQEPGQVDHQLYRRYRHYLVSSVLGNGSFYRRAREDLGATGIAWPLGSLTATCDLNRIGAATAAARGHGQAAAVAPVAYHDVPSVAVQAAARVTVDEPLIVWSEREQGISRQQEESRAVQ